MPPSSFFSALDSLCAAFIILIGNEVLFSSIAFLVVLSLSFLFRKYSPYLHYGLWALVFARLVLPPNLSHDLSAREILERFSVTLSSYGFLSTSQAGHPIESLERQLSKSATAGAKGSTSSDQSFLNRVPLSSSVVFLWLIGVFIFAMLYSKRLREIQNITRKSYPVNQREILHIRNKWQRQLNIKKNVRIVSSDAFLSPFTFGFLRPVIYLPQIILAQENLATAESIMAHEMAHIKRWDNFWLKLQTLIQLIYFFHPIVWMANDRLNQARERICDRLVIASGMISPEVYGKSMLTVLNLNLIGPKGLELTPAFGNHKRRFEMRIQKLTTQSKIKKENPFLIFTAVLLVGSFVLPMANYTIEKSSRSNSLTTDRIQEKHLNEASNQEIKFSDPLPDGRITEWFGKTLDPFNNSVRHHNGVDIAAPKGTEIFAAADGIVETAKMKYRKNSGFGRLVVIDHGQNLRTFYGQMDTLFVETGQRVECGEVIGLVGKTGRTTGPHLHFEVHKTKKAVNPVTYIPELKNKPARKPYIEE